MDGIGGMIVGTAAAGATVIAGTDTDATVSGLFKDEALAGTGGADAVPKLPNDEPRIIHSTRVDCRRSGIGCSRTGDESVGRIGSAGADGEAGAGRAGSAGAGSVGGAGAWRVGAGGETSPQVTALGPLAAELGSCCCG